MTIQGFGVQGVTGSAGGVRTGPAVTSMQDVFDWTVRAGKKDYRGPVKRCSKFFEGKDLGEIPVDLDDFKRRFPLAPKSLEGFRTLKAYRAWRRKVIAAIKGATGLLAGERARRDRRDGWRLLIDRIAVHTHAFHGMHHENILISIGNLADEARKQDIPPEEITSEIVLELAAGLSLGRRTSVERGLARLNEVHYLPEVAALLPNGPFDPVSILRRERQVELPDHLERDVQDWVVRITRGTYDEIDDTFVDGMSGGACGVYQAAIRKFLSTAISIGALNPAAVNGLAGALTKERLGRVIRHWRDTASSPAGISARTAAAYCSAIQRLARRNRHKVKGLKKLLSNSRYLREGRRQSDRMTPETQAFCAQLLEDRRTRNLFRSMHVQLQRKAQAILDAADGREMTVKETQQVREIGTCAAFCAIELRASPVRVANVLDLRHLGDGRWLILPCRRETRHARLHIPAEFTKNKTWPIRARIRQDQYQGLQVLEWYRENIRPLFPAAYKLRDGEEERPEDTPLSRRDDPRYVETDYFFPGFSHPQLLYSSLNRWLQKWTAEVGLPMTAHRFRHGCASILADRNPGEFDRIARYLGDKPDTVRRYYAWINYERNNARAQDEIMKDFDARKGRAR